MRLKILGALDLFVAIGLTTALVYNYQPLINFGAGFAVGHLLCRSLENLWRPMRS